MPDILEPIFKKFTETFSSLLVFVFVFTILYALLRKSKMLGESPLMNGAVSFVASFLVTWFSVSIMPLTQPLSIFFAQGTAILLFVIFGVIAASLFYPDLPKMLADQFVKRGTFYMMIVLGIVLFITSGLVSTLWAPSSIPPKPGETRPSTDIILVSAGVIIFVVLLAVAAKSVVGD